MMDNKYHTPVLLQEVLDALNVKPDKKYIDATLGGGGHTWEILDKGGIVLGIDQDEEALNHVESRIKNQKITVAKGNFREIGKIAREHGFGQVQGILFDLGVSSRQFENSKRGFSFSKNGPLDMRMDTTLAFTASDLVNALTAKELTELFLKYGEEYKAKRIADEIVKIRKTKPLETTQELAELVKKVYGRASGTIHPATKVFQALRIAVNDELHSIEDALPEALDVLAPGGRIAVISFHSLEDRIVKHTFLDFQKKGLGHVLTKKPILPSEQEIRVNRRSRSAKLRVFEKSE